jgi:aminopeptidase N
LKSFPLPGATPQYGPDKLVHVEHIDLYLTPDLAAQRMEGVCTTTVRAIDDGVSELTLDAVDFVVGWVRDEDGHPLHFHRGAGTLRVHLPKTLAAGERTSFAVAYRIEHPRAGLYFVAPTKEHPDKPTQCWTQSQDEYARYWFPCFDYPHAKQTTSTTIVVPTGTFALGNGRLAERRDDPASGYTTFRYVQDVPHSTYLVTMVAGSFAEIEQRGARVPIYYYVVPGREADGERSFAKTPKMMAVFEERTGMPYPYARYSQIAVADFIFGGMENTSATTQTDRTLHDARAHLDFSSDGLVAHELAHQWFGDLITTRDWSHAWLNEGFATFFDAVFREADLGKDEYLYAIYEYVQTYLREHSERYARAIVENRFLYPIEVFDRHLYEKGGAVLHMLRGTLGEACFWRAIRHYVREFAQKSVETIDLVRAIESATGRNTREFFDQWIFRAGHPALRVSFDYDRSRRMATVRVEQKQPVDEENPAYRFELEIGFLHLAPAAIEQDAGGRPLEGERRHRLSIDVADQSFAFADDVEPAMVRVDPDATVLCTMEYAFDVPHLALTLAADPSPTSRIRAALALAKDRSPAALAALGDALERDPFWAVRAEVAKALGSTRTTRAKELLHAACADPHPKTRRGVAEALGNYRSADAADTLLALAAGDPSYHVVAEALEALGKTRDARAFSALHAALEVASWTDVIASGAARGLAELDDPRAVTAIVAATASSRGDVLRAEALRALGRAAQTNDFARGTAVDRIVACLDDESFMVRRAAISAARKAEDRRALAALERIAAAGEDGRLRRNASEAAHAIRKASATPAQVAQLQTELESLRADYRLLLERLDATKRT